MGGGGGGGAPPATEEEAAGVGGANGAAGAAGGAGGAKGSGGDELGSWGGTCGQRLGADSGYVSRMPRKYKHFVSTYIANLRHKSLHGISKDRRSLGGVQLLLVIAATHCHCHYHHQ